MAKIEIQYHPAAAEEVVRANNWYENIDPNVAQKFKRELDRAERLVSRSPAAWASYFHGTSGFRFRGFPFVMAYILREESIFVIALAHSRRRPGYWKKRIR